MGELTRTGRTTDSLRTINDCETDFNFLSVEAASRPWSDASWKLPAAFRAFENRVNSSDSGARASGRPQRLIETGRHKSGLRVEGPA